jgi:hypothetical protein
MSVTRDIKKLLEAHYGRGRVRIKSERGTGTGTSIIGVDCLDTKEERERVKSILVATGENPAHFLVRLNSRGAV